MDLDLDLSIILLDYFGENSWLALLCWSTLVLVANQDSMSFRFALTVGKRLTQNSSHQLADAPRRFLFWDGSTIGRGHRWDSRHGENRYFILVIIRLNGP